MIYRYFFSYEQNFVPDYTSFLRSVFFNNCFMSHTSTLSFVFQKMEFCYISGYSSGCLLYLKSEKHLFVRKETKNNRTYWVCYDTIKSGAGSCKSRCIVDEKTKKCNRNDTPHGAHENHELDFKDLVSLNAMKDHCRYLAQNFPYSAHKIPIKAIFMAEMIK